MGETEIQKMGVCCQALFFVIKPCQLFVCLPAPGWGAGGGYRPEKQMLNEPFPFVSQCVCVCLSLVGPV